MSVVEKMGGCGLAITSGGDVSGESNDGGSLSDSGGAIWFFASTRQTLY